MNLTIKKHINILLANNTHNLTDILRFIKIYADRHDVALIKDLFKESKESDKESLALFTKLIRAFSW